MFTEGQEMGMCTNLFCSVFCFESIGGTSEVYRPLYKAEFYLQQRWILHVRVTFSVGVLQVSAVSDSLAGIISSSPSWKNLAQAAATCAFISRGSSSRVAAIPQGLLACIRLQQPLHLGKQAG